MKDIAKQKYKSKSSTERFNKAAGIPNGLRAHKARMATEKIMKALRPLTPKQRSKVLRCMQIMIEP